MVWTSRDDGDPGIVLGRKVLGAAIRRARLRHRLSQRQLGWYVGLDQTTISRLETAKLKGLRFRMLARMIGMLSSGDRFDLLDAPARAPRRLPGEVEATQPSSPPSVPAPSYDDDGHGPFDVDLGRRIRSYEDPALDDRLGDRLGDALDDRPGEAA